MKKLLRFLGAVSLGAACTSVVRAGDQTFDMDSDPSGVPGFIEFGNHIGSSWNPTDGKPATGGFLSLTDAAGSTTMGIIFPSVDLYTNADGSVIDLPVAAFSVDADLRIGNGTTQRPADGFSISFARASDPVIYWASQGPGNFRGFAGGDSDAQALEPASDPTQCDSGTAENGTKTGLAIQFDTWQGNRILDESGNATGDNEGWRVHLDGKRLVAVNAMGPDGNYDRNGLYVCPALDASLTQDPTCALACGDTNSLQTGVWTGGDGSYAALCWQHLHAEVDTNKQVTVIWKGRTILDHFQLTNFPTSQGRLILAARTGGNNENTHVDNVHVVTVPSVQTTLADVAPIGPGLLYGFKADFNSIGPSIVTNLVQVLMDTTDVTSTMTLSTNGLIVTATYLQAGRLASGVNHPVKLTAKDARGQTYVFTSSFTTPSYFAIPTNLVMTLAQVDTNKPGFMVKSYQTTWLQPQPNWLRWTEEQVVGYHGPNAADQGMMVNGLTNFTGAADFSQPGGSGYFQSANGSGYDYDFNLFGIGGNSATNFTGSPVGDNCALELYSYVYFPTNGYYHMYVGSDDGFRVSVAANAQDHVGAEMMSFDGGRGIGSAPSSATSREIVIDQAGVYPLRMLWENGGGGYALEWYFEYSGGTNFILLNDDGSVTTQVSPIKAYQVAKAAAPFVKSAIPVKGATIVPLDQAIIVDLGDGIPAPAAAVNTNSLAFILDGSTRPVVVSKSADTTHIVYTPSSLWAQASPHTVMLTYQDTSGKSYTNQWSWTAETSGGGGQGGTSLPIVQIPGAWGKDPSQIDHTQPGFRIRSYQTTAGNNNTVTWTEQQLMGLHGPDITDPTGATNNGYFSWPDVVDFSGHVGAGTSGAAFPYNYGLENVGIQGNPSNPDNSTMEIGTWIEFPAAGIYSMEVNSDDGFLVSVSPRGDTHDKSGVVLGWANFGRGSSGPWQGTSFQFYVQAAGAYPFRLLWEDGGGGAGVEWTIQQHLPDGSFQDLLIGETNVPGAIKSYQVAKVEPPHLLGYYPVPDFAGRESQRHDISRAQQISILLQSGSKALNTGSIVLTANGVTVPASVVSAGSNNIWVVSYTPDINNPATWWPSGGDVTFALAYSDGSGSYSNQVFTMATEYYGTLAGGYPLGSGDAARRGFLMKTYQVDGKQGTATGGGQTTINRVAENEQVLTGLFGPNVINPTNTYGYTMVNGYWVVAGTGSASGVINFDINGPDGDFTPSNGHPEHKWPGIPGLTGDSGQNQNSFAAEMLAYVEFPTNGHYTLGFNSDDGFRITRGWGAPNWNGSLLVGSPAAVAGNYGATPGSYLGTRQVTNFISGKVVQALGVGGGTENGTRPGISIEGCPPLVNGPALAGNIALLYRGTCNYFEKLQGAKDAGAIGVIMVQNRPKVGAGDGVLPPEFGGDPLIDIPAISIERSVGDALVAAMATNDVMATLTPLQFDANPPASQAPLGQADWGKGASDVLFDVNVPTAGVYPLRALWFQGGGGANAEWFSVVGGNKVLLNDDASTNGPALKAYYAVTVRPTVSLSVGASSITVNYTGTLQMSHDLRNWVDVYGQPPYVTSTSDAAEVFFRAR